MFSLTTTTGDISIDQNVTANNEADKILIVAADELNLNAQLSRGTSSDSLDVSNLNPDSATSALILDPSDTSGLLALVNSDTRTQDFEYHLWSAWRTEFHDHGILRR